MGSSSDNSVVSNLAETLSAQLPYQRKASDCHLSFSYRSNRLHLYLVEPATSNTIHLASCRMDVELIVNMEFTNKLRKGVSLTVKEVELNE